MNSVVSAIEMIRAGAWLVGALTGVMYEGPFLAHRINRGVLRFLNDHNLNNLSDLRLMGMER